VPLHQQQQQQQQNRLAALPPPANNDGLTIILAFDFYEPLCVAFRLQIVGVYVPLFISLLRPEKCLLMVGSNVYNCYRSVQMMRARASLLDSPRFNCFDTDNKHRKQ
jgi:hypothetical protein